MIRLPPEILELFDDIFSNIELRYVFEMTEEEELEYVKKYVEILGNGNCECLSVKKISENNYEACMIVKKPLDYIDIKFTIQDGEVVK